MIRNTLRNRLSSLAAAGMLAAMAATSAARAEPALGQGVGTYTCAEFIRDARATRDGDVLYFSWAQGWMTGWNLAEMNASKPTVDLALLSITEQRTYVRGYCRDHPAGMYMDAVHQLYESLRSRER